MIKPPRRQVRRNVHYVRLSRPVCRLIVNAKRSTQDVPLVSCVACLHSIINVRDREIAKLHQEKEEQKEELENEYKTRYLMGV